MIRSPTIISRESGIIVSTSEYKAGKGSVIIELKPTFLKTFSVGERTLKAEFNDAKFTILASEVVNLPRTGDKNNVLVGLIALA